MFFLDPSLTILLTGNSSSVQFRKENILLGQKETNMENADISIKNKIECLFNENQQQPYTGDIDNTSLRQKEELKKTECGEIFFFFFKFPVWTRL